MAKQIFLALFLCISSLGTVGAALAYRPLGTEDAGVAGKDAAQLELGWDYIRWEGEIENVFLVVPSYGLTERLEVSAELPYDTHRPAAEAAARGLGDINLAGKYQLLPEGGHFPALAVKGVVKLATGDYAKGLGSGDEDYTVFVASTKTMGRVAVHAHLGYTWVGRGKDPGLRNIDLYGFAVDCGLTEALHAVGEIDGNRHPERNENQDPRVALLGVTFKQSEKLTFDAGLRKGLTATTPKWSTTTGITLSF